MGIGGLMSAIPTLANVGKMASIFGPNPQSIPGGSFWKTIFPQLAIALGTDLTQNTKGKNLSKTMFDLLQSGQLTKLLGGMFGAGSSMTFKDGGMNIKVPGQTGGTNGTSTVAPTSTTPVGVPSTGGGGGMSDLIGLMTGAFGGQNPNYGLSGLKLSDLAGLEPDMIFKALGAAQTEKGLSQQSLRDLSNSIYQQGLLNYYQGQLALGRDRVELDKEVNAINRANAARQWVELFTKDERTTLEKEYDAAVEQGYDGKLEDWKVITADPTIVRTWKAAVEDGSFKGGLWDFIKQEAEAGRSVVNVNTLQDTLRKEEALTQLAAWDWFRSDWSGELEEIVPWEGDAYDLSQKYMKEGLEYNEASQKAVLDTKLITIQRKLKAAGAKNIKITKNQAGTVYKFKFTRPEIKDSSGNVLLPSKEETIEYAVR